MNKELKKINFITNSNLKYSNKYDYSLVEYIGCDFKVLITCPLHGVFSQSPYVHLNGLYGCPKCSIEINANKLKNNVDDFIKRSIDIHGDKYDYSFVKYVNCGIKVKITCKEHGIFEQSPATHVKGVRCPKCSGRNNTTEEIIKKLCEVHDNRYDYSLLEYKRSVDKVKIICSEHGIFEQSPSNHMLGKGCPKCYGRNKTTADILKEFMYIHEDIYDYSLVKYTTSHSKVKIICREHGIFEQTPSKHLMGRGCHKCKSSVGEQKIRKYLNKNEITAIEQKTFNGCDYRGKLRFDFYIPDRNICIEFDGIQHFIPFSFTSNRTQDNLKRIFNEQRIKDDIKSKYCSDNNILLLRIPYTNIRVIDYILDSYLFPVEPNPPLSSSSNTVTSSK